MKSKSIPIYKSSSNILDEDDFFNIKWLDLNIDSLEKIKKPHRHDYFSIYFLISGETIQFIDFHEYKVQANALIVMRPEQIHFHVKAKNAKLLLISFKEQFLMSLQSRNNWHDIFGADVIELDSDSMQAFMNFINLMIEEYDSELKNKEILAKIFSALLDKISLHLKKNDSLEKRKKYNSIYKGFKQLVTVHALEEVKVSDYAKRLFVSPGHLNDVIKEITGKNAKTLINEQRILEAKRLLFWTNTPIREVAYQTGFDDPAYFTRFFKKYTGLLPSDFQQKD
ncbi:helix-turn-helix domain-containing protein [Albibacterium bauzanense]|uniref:AraC-like DNA-binding protein n=1 Tax=Albibacterium bauzanense TaxID=653929 RepID=A0A4R1M0G8_9SPHI|nr:helix-turn-helix domain-containing protein [Albibacterium bauzanense]TCK85105.1 AraC-like DNA-binding protein [Albibacterium bauzanense]